MTISSYEGRDLGGPGMVEGTARVIATEAGVAWLVPEQGPSCGSCSASSACGAKGIGTVESRLEFRRFPLDNAAGLRVGERVIVGIPEDALVKASMTVYVLPLLITFAAGGVAQWLFGRDGVTMLAMFGGLLLGFAAIRIGAKRMSARGETTLRYLRRAAPGEACHSD